MYTKEKENKQKKVLSKHNNYIYILQALFVNNKECTSTKMTIFLEIEPRFQNNRDWGNWDSTQVSYVY